MYTRPPGFRYFLLQYLPFTNARASVYFAGAGCAATVFTFPTSLTYTTRIVTGFVSWFFSPVGLVHRLPKPATLLVRLLRAVLVLLGQRPIEHALPVLESSRAQVRQSCLIEHGLSAKSHARPTLRANVSDASKNGYGLFISLRRSIFHGTRLISQRFLCGLRSKLTCHVEKNYTGVGPHPSRDGTIENGCNSCCVVFWV